MTTELQRQVAQFQKHTIQHQSLQHGKPSIFLSPKEAAAVDVSTVYDAAITGLNVLIQYDKQFQKFLERLLHPTSTSIQRELKTKEENAELDNEINQLLSLLSLWSFEPNAHLVLEYLIRRYLVHEYNTDMLIRCMLVAHDTKVFGRIIHLCRLADTRWVFFSTTKDAGGNPVSRPFLIKRVLKAPWLLEVIVNIALNALQLIGIRKAVGVNSINSLLVEGASKAVGFATAIILETADQVAFDDSKMRAIYLFIVEGLKIGNNSQLFVEEQSQLLLDWKCSCCLIISQLSRKTTFAEPLKRVLANSLAESISKRITFNDEIMDSLLLSVFTTISFLAGNGTLALTPKLLQQFSQLNDTTTANSDNSLLIDYLSSTDFSFLASHLLNKALVYLVDSDLMENNTGDDSPDQNANISVRELESLITSLLRQDYISQTTIRYVLSGLLRSIITGTRFSPDRHDAIKVCCKLISQRHSLVFDEVVTDFYQSDEVGKELPEEIDVAKTRLTDFLNEFFDNSEILFSINGAGNLFMTLHHPIKSIRLEGIKKIITLNYETLERTEDTASLMNDLYQNLAESDVEIAALVWNKTIITMLLQFLSNDDIRVAAVNALKWWFLSMNESNSEDHLFILSKILLSINDESVLALLFDENLSSTDLAVAQTRLRLLGWIVSLHVGVLPLSEKFQQLVFKLKMISRELLEKSGLLPTFLSSRRSSSLHENERANCLVESILDQAKKNATEFSSKRLIASSSHSFFELLLKVGSVREIPFVTISLLSLLNELAPRLVSSENQVSFVPEELQHSMISLAHDLINEFTDEPSIQTLSTFLSVYGKLKFHRPNSEKAMTLTEALSCLNSKSVNVVFQLEKKFFQNLCISNNRLCYQLIDNALLQLFGSDNYLVVLISMLFPGNAAPSGIVAQENESFQVIIYQILSLSVKNFMAAYGEVEKLQQVPNSKQRKDLSAVSNVTGENVVFVAIFPILLWGVMHENLSVRKCALSLCELIHGLSLQNSKKLNYVEMEDGRAEHKLVINLQTIQLFCFVVVQKSTLISSHPQSTLAVITEHFKEFADNFKELRTEMWNLLIWYVENNLLPFSTLVLAFIKTQDLQSDDNTVDSLLTLVNKSILSSVHLPQSSESFESVAELIRSCLSHRKIKNQKVETKVIDFIQELFSHEDSVQTMNAIEFKTLFLRLIADGYLSSSENIKTLSHLLFQHYLSQQLETSNNSRRKTNIALVPANLYANALIGLTIDEEIYLLELSNLFEEYQKWRYANNNEIPDKERNGRYKITGHKEMAFIIRKLEVILEIQLKRLATSSEELKSTDSNSVERANQSSQLVKLIFQFISSFQQSKDLLLVTAELGLSLDYIYSMLMELASIHLQVIFEESVLLASFSSWSSKGKKGNNSKYKGSNSTISTDQVRSYVLLIIDLVAAMKSFPLEVFAFKSLQLLISFCFSKDTPSDTATEVSQLAFEGTARYLSSIHDLEHLEKHLQQVIQLRSLCLKNSEAKEVLALSTMQSICHHFVNNLVNNTVNMLDRQTLIRSAIKIILGKTEDQKPNSDEESYLFISMFTALICQTISCYENTNNSLNNNVGPAADSICLSKAAERRAKRAVTSSLPEQIYQLAFFLFFQLSPFRQVSVLNILVLYIQKFFVFSLTGSGDMEREGHPFVIQSLKYLHALDSNVDEKKMKLMEPSDTNSLQGYSSTIAIICLESIIEILENKKFHRNIAKSPSLSSGSSIQKDLLIFSDSFLQVIVSVEGSRNFYAQVQQKEKILLRLEHDVYHISKYSLCDILFNHILTSIQAFQQLLDLPSFITIIQELLNHDILLIRQKAIVILKNRLQESSIAMDSSGKKAEMELYFELLQKMKCIAFEYFKSLDHSNNHRIEDKPTIKSHSSKESLQNGQIPLVQSAIMCADILFQYLGKPSNMSNQLKNEMMQISQSFVKYIPLIYERAAPNELATRDTGASAGKEDTELKKLLGAVLLCHATIFRILGASMLAVLPATMEELLKLHQSEVELLLSRLHTHSNVIMISLMKNEILFIRSIILSMNIISSSMANFIHNYLQLTIIQLVNTFSLSLSPTTSSSLTNNKISNKLSSELQFIFDDVQSFLAMIIKDVPVRLLIPQLSPIIKEVFRQRKSSSLSCMTLVKWIADFTKVIDRNAIINQLSQWTTVSIDLLNYRSLGKCQSTKEEVHADVVQEGRNDYIGIIEKTASEIITEISLKFTEKELKGFVLKLLDWKNKDLSDEDDDKENSDIPSRGIPFYLTINELITKLKFLFNPTMNLLWDDYIENMSKVKTFIQTLIDQGTETNQNNSEVGNKKKRKKLTEVKQFLSPKDQNLLQSLQNYNIILLQLIQTLSDSGRGTFINEARYETLYQLPLYYLPLRELFANDDDYLGFNRDVITPTLIQLCLSIQRDLLWKPLNYQVLLQSRHSLAIVRKSSIVILGKLFQEVGDEYLHLLPECIQFISELLEDSNSEVVAATRDTITIIEDLSGEKLDSYLAH